MKTLHTLRLVLLCLLFAGVPIIYAWLYIPGLEGNLSDIAHTLFPAARWWGFESVKVRFFEILMVCIVFVQILLSLVEAIDREEKWNISTSKVFDKAFILSVLVFFVWSVTSYILNYSTNPFFLSGTFEKMHGWFFYACLFVLFWIVSSLTAQEKKNIFRASLVGAVGVALYAYFQKIDLDPLRPLYTTRLDRSRAFSTLGNPNYLAGYVLMFLPLLRHLIRDKLSYLGELCIWIGAWVLLYWTGSYLAWALFAVYACIVFLEHAVTDTRQRRFIWCLLIACFIVWISTRYQSDIWTTEKVKGFIARWYLWKTGVTALIADIPHFLFWYWPDGFLAVSERFRDWHLSHGFEDPAYRIDRAHNVFIDTALQFGVPIAGILLYVLWKHFKKLPTSHQQSLILFALYFSFNIPVLVHFMILALLVSPPHSLHQPRPDHRLSKL
jgi:hypothetical protein